MAIGTGLALAAGAIGSAAIGASGAKKAAKANVDAAKTSTDLQKAIYTDTSEKLEPFRAAGQNAFTAYLSELGLGEAPEGYGGYMESPMASYLLTQGRDTIEGGAAARGGLYSGSTLKALEDHRQGVIGADVDSYLSKLFGVSQMGQNAAAQQGAAGTQFANAAGNNIMAAGRAAGQGYTNAAQSIQTGIGDVAGIYGYFNSPYMQNPMAAYAAPTLGMNTGIPGVY